MRLRRLAGQNIMSGDFDRRLAEAKARARKNRDQTDTEDARKQAEWEQQLAKVEAAIREWKVRIEPAIRNAVMTAHQQLSHSGIHLTARPEPTHLASRKVTITPLPALSIIGRLEGQAPYLTIRVDTNGMIAFAPSRGISAPAPMEASACTEEKIQSVIADFIDALIP